MQADVKALQQQALSTQAALRQLQARESVDPMTAFKADLPSMPTINTSILGVASLLLIGLTVVWWYLWRRPATRFVDAARTARPELEAVSDFVPHFKSQHQLQPAIAPVAADSLRSEPSTQSDILAEPHEWGTKDADDTGFDSEAAAGEVIRVRKSLAQKREARQRLRAKESIATPPPQAEMDPWRLPGEAAFGDSVPPVDLGIQFTLPDASIDAADGAPIDMLEPLEADNAQSADHLDFNFDEFESPVSLELVSDVAIESPAEPPVERQLAVDLDVAAQPEPAMEAEHHEPEASSFAITMALAQESATLELWDVARDMAREVMESNDPELMREAQALLDQLNVLESQMGPETTSWSDLR